MDSDTDKDMQPYSRYSAAWITCDTSRRKFQQRYKLVALLPDENYNKQIGKNSYRCWNCLPNDVLAELEISVWIKNRPLPEVRTVIGN